jgi:spermidine/putrescine transport system permease protein
MSAVDAAPVSIGRSTGSDDEGPGRRRHRLPKFALALPSWIWYLGLFIVPLIFIVVYSFGTKVQGSAGDVDTSHPTLDRYRQAFNHTFFEVLKQTLRTSIIGTFLCFVIGFPVAYFIAIRVAPRWRGVLLGLVIVPFWTNFLIRTIAWKIVLSPKGFFSNWFQTIGVRDTPIQVLNTRFAVQLGVVYNYLPLMIFPLFVALDRLDPALREASKDLGANRIRTFFQVTLPLASPGIVAGLLLVFIPLTGDYITAAVLGGAKGNMAGALVAAQFLQAQNKALGSAVAMVLIGAILLCIAVAGVVSIVVRAVLRRRRAVDVEAPPAATKVVFA